MVEQTAPQPSADEDNADDALLARFSKWFGASRDHSAKWREKAREDFAFVAGSQWSEEDKGKLNEQLRPVIVFNRIGPIVDAVAGYEVNNRQEAAYLPRQQGDVEVNELITAAAKWVRGECDAEDEESDAFVDSFTCGMGWTETVIQYDIDPEGMIDIDRYDPLEAYWDPKASKKNLSDARWVCRVRKFERDEVGDLFPDVDLDELEEGGPWAEAGEHNESPHDATEAPFYRNDQQDRALPTGKLTVAQFQWWDKVPVYRVLDQAQGKIVEMSAQDHEKLQQRAKVLGMPVRSARVMRRQYRQAFVIGETIVKNEPCPCDKDFTLKCITAKRDRNHNTWYGIVRALKDPARWGNKWLSQILHILNSNAKGGVLAEKDAFENVRKAEEQWAQPDGWVWTKAGAISQGRIKVRDPVQMPQDLPNLLTYAITSLRDVSGVNIETLGQAGTDQAGVLDQYRKQASMNILAPLFDSLRRYRKEHGRVLLYFIQRYISDGRLIRIDGPDARRYVPLLRDPGVAEFDVIIDQAPFSPNQQEKVWEALQSLLPMAVQAGIPVPPDVIDYSPLPAGLKASWKKLLTTPRPPNPLNQMAKVADIERTIADARNKEATGMANLLKAGADAQDAHTTAMHSLVDSFAPDLPLQQMLPGLEGGAPGAPPGAPTQQQQMAASLGVPGF